MIEPVTMWRVRCDRCGQADDCSDYAAWSEPDQAAVVAADWHDWWADGHYHLCPDCQEPTPEDDE